MYKKASKNEEKQDRNLKILVYLMLMFFFFGVIVSRLFYLQVIQFEENFNRSENNRLRQVILRAERGFVFDRKGRVLVRNRPSYQVVLQSMSLPKKKEERDSVFVRLLKIHDLEGKFLFDSLSLDTAFQRANWIRIALFKF
jgi:penicillin-binding protein 2